jgi:ketosteroid isomerase-like protein|tara:strand:- start:2459 stop:2893 length:435 start_codon:yes stop_codon:yes gene_type:complete
MLSLPTTTQDTAMIEQTIERWHRLVDTKDTKDAEALNDILADNVVFHSPVVHTPQEGKAITKMYLTAALHTLNNEHFRYEREILDGRNAVLEFTTVLDGIQLNGIDMIHCDEDGRIDDFKVMVRPLKAVNKIHEMMGAMLKKLG